MCGIYGYIGNEAACQIILDGLQKLHYRGYDSWGIVTLVNGEFHCIKRVGYITESDITEITLPGNIGVGHVRWATHGSISERNAHPHFDCKHEIAIVHNGVIYNESSLRNRLIQHGHFFNSDTDTELFAHLLEEEAGQGFIDAIYNRIQEIDAQYSFLILTKKEPNKIYAARNRSPLKIGIGENGFHVSSDVVSLVGVVTKYIDLEDGDVAEITAEEFKIYDRDKQSVQRQSNPIDIPEELVKKQAPYFLKEVYEQEKIIRDVTRSYIRGHKIDLGIDVDKITPIEGVILTGAGSSFFASLIGEYYLRKISRLPRVECVLAAELAPKYGVDLRRISKNLLLVALTQSGETRDVLDAIDFARNNGVRVLTLVNRPRSEAAKISDFAIDLQAGPEMSVVASKTFVAEILVILLLSIALAQKRKITKEIKKLIREIEELPSSIKEIFEQQGEIEQIARNPKYLSEKELAFYPLSSGINVPIALEMGRKLEEGLYVHAIGTSLGASSELKHGPLTRVTNKTLIFIIPSGSEHRKMLIHMSEAKARGARIIAVATRGDEAVQTVADDTIWLPECNELLTPILSIIPLQLLAYYLGKESGRGNLDRPRNLAKSVTVE